MVSRAEGRRLRQAAGWVKEGQRGETEQSEGGTSDCHSCPQVPLAGQSGLQMLTFPLLLPEVESTLEPSRAVPCPRAGRELKTKPRIFRGEANLSV